MDQRIFDGKHLNQYHPEVAGNPLGYHSKGSGGHHENGSEKKKDELIRSGYKPNFLVVDEFTIHKGHRYPTCVMDLETSELIWVGKGRARRDFAKFFEAIDSSYLSEVKTVAMDMNASYHSLVEANLPHVQIVYDRYHMQAQYGRDVMGVVRLEEAQKHRDASKELTKSLNQISSEENKAKIKQKAKEEQREYGKLKRSRWILLMNIDNLRDSRQKHLNEILKDHENLTVCCAMKEEMIRLFELKDKEKASNGWTHWFEAAKESGIPALGKFARLKEKRLPGLVAHAVYPINTGKLEGFNNKIKVAKRISYGYKDEDYFFTLIRYLSLSTISS